MNPPIINTSFKRLEKPILAVAFIISFFFFQKIHLYGNSLPKIAHTTNDFSSLDDCLKGIALPLFGGSVVTSNDVIPICQTSITGTNDVEFELISVIDFDMIQPPQPGSQYFLRYTLNAVSVTDPNLNNPVSTTLEGSTLPMDFDGPVNDGNFNQLIQDDIILNMPSNFLQPATITYSITVQLMEQTATDVIPSQTCTPRGFSINVEVLPTPQLTAQLVNPVDSSVCDDQLVPLTASVVQSSTGIQSFSWSVISSDPGFGGTFSNPFSATTNFIGSIDNSIVDRGEQGTVTVEVAFSDGNGCMTTEQLDIELFRAIGALACNDLVNISLDDDCSLTIEPDAVLEGSYGDYELFEVLVFDRNKNIGNTVDGSLIGKNLTVRVIDRCSGNYCWGQLNLEDKFSPEIDCSAANFKTNIITGTIDAGDVRFHRSVALLQGEAGACSLSPMVGTMTRYEAVDFEVTVSGTYEFEMVTAEVDMFAAIYENSFNPGDACMNIVAADDDNSAFPFAPKITVILNPGNYILVTSAHFNDGLGGYQWRVTGPGTAGINQGVCLTNSDTISIACTTDLSTLPSPKATDNCEGNITPTLIGENTRTFGCGRGDGTVAIVTKTWRATDSRGNTSNNCTQVIKLVRKTLADVVFPPDFDDMTEPAFNCTQPMSVAHPDSTGYPTIDGSPITVDNTCMLNIGYEDLTLPTCGGGKKILREWTVLDWCEPLEPGINPLIHTQLIKFVDKTPPQIICPDDFSVSADYSTIPGSHVGCIANPTFPAMQVSDSCSNVGVTISTPYGVINGNGGSLTGFPLGEYDITYSARDACGNDTSCVVKMTVTDDLEPVAVCIDILSVSLTANGTAQINATAFDAGSYDNCCLDRFEVKRMNQGNRFFAPSITFDCDDIPNNNIMVNVRVWDCFDNSNQCMVEVEVEDKLPPILICPGNITISCTEDPFDFDLTGNVTNLEVCPISLADFSDKDDRNKCGIGTITRTFRSIDANGNTGRCRQTITVINDNPFNPDSITWPRDTMFVDDCGRGIHPDSLPAGYNYPTYPDDFCADVYVNYTDTPFDRVPGVCLKLIRKWTIIDWCQMNNGNGGRYEHEQEIILMDGKKPDIVCPDSLSVSVGKNCLAQIQIDTAQATDCTNTFTHSISGDFNQYGLIDDVTIGTYSVTLSVTDGCRNTSSCIVPIFVRDSIPPTAVCSPISVNLDTITKSAWVKARSLNPGNPDPSSTDNCTDVWFSFSDHIDDSMRMYTCADTGTFAINLWVTDLYGNNDFCSTTITVQDNWGCCSPGTGSKPSIAGSIKNNLDQPVANIDVALSGNMNTPLRTDAEGKFKFKDLTPGSDYSIFPFCNENFDNGVTTFDIVRLSRHILNVEKLNSPYLLIAADANRSGSITTLDITAIRKLVLHTADEFPNSTPSWRFVETDYVFPDPQDPWAETFPEIHNINDLNTADYQVNFTAIKIGDVSGDAIMNADGNVLPRTYNKKMTLKTTNQFFENDNYLKVDFTIDNLERFIGWQGTLIFDSDLLQFSEIIPGTEVDEDNFGKAFLHEGILTVSWNGQISEDILPEEPLFSLVFKTNGTGDLASAIALNGSLTKAESYTTEGETFGVALEVENGTSAVQLFQNEPNPFSEKTTIRFYLPESMPATLTIVDVSGKPVKVFTDKYEKGTHEIVLYKSDLPRQGVLYYRLQTDNFNGVKKMLIID